MFKYDYRQKSKNIVFEDYKDKHAGERVFLIANGPSLKDTNLDLLKDETTIAMNRISLIYPSNSQWRPTYYLFSSTNVRHPDWGRAWTDSVRTAICQEETTPFVAKMFKPTIDPTGEYGNVGWFESMSEKKPPMNGDISEDCFSTNIVERIDKSGTTMNLALQLSYHMGFKEIVVVGADLGWSGDRGSKNDPNHFDSSYRADIPPEKVYKINNQMRNVHSLAYKNFTERDSSVKFYNASAKTVLDVYPIINFESYILNDKVEYEDDKLREAREFWDKEPQYGKCFREI
tara:strand:+ start:8631 stop:9494 length:864 start_codon:yes stop_codon:yes gene_type:complete